MQAAFNWLSQPVFGANRAAVLCLDWEKTLPTRCDCLALARTSGYVLEGISLRSVAVFLPSFSQSVLQRLLQNEMMIRWPRYHVRLPGSQHM